MPCADRRLGPADAVAGHGARTRARRARRGTRLSSVTAAERSSTQSAMVGRRVGEGAIDSRRAVSGAQPLQGAGEHDQSLAVVGRVLRGLDPQHLLQRERILARLQR